MKAFTQHLSSLIRFGDAAEKYGDEWDDTVTIVWLSPTEVLLVGMKSDFSAEKFRAIEAEGSRLGIDKATWFRVKNGAERRIEWKIRHDLYRKQQPANE